MPTENLSFRVPNPYVFTVFFCGTGSNSLNGDWERAREEAEQAQIGKYKFVPKPWDELVATLANNHTGTEFVEWVIIDGPGSGNLQEDDKWVKPGNYPKLLGTLWGAGWKENVDHALAMIKGIYEWKRTQLTAEQVRVLKDAGYIDQRSFFQRILSYPDRKANPQELQAQKAKILRKGRLPDVVNLIGWSRGAVSCHMLANKMFQDTALRGIRVNIFAVDPVPGLGRYVLPPSGYDFKLIPSNVYNYVAIYARDEYSIGFTPIVPDFSAQMRNKPIILPLPGRHATLVANAAIDGGEGTQDQELLAPGRLVRHLAEEYLTAWGTALKNRLNLSLREVDGFYESIVRNNGRYIAMRSSTYTAQQIQGNERKVAKGSDLLSKYFSDIRGAEYLHPEGLAPVNGYLSWHHKQIRMQVTPPIAQQQSVDRLFPHFASGLNYALFSEPITLNGMKMIFDQPVGVYPVNLESKEEARRNGN
ncbi:hypothetical protein [Nostoc sp. CCY 9925]|uniref:hypothetical protein n=1 Tax=Nostoc sp. CCY 9925 TaxID=3103865 RepID=UPI0039C70712